MKLGYIIDDSGNEHRATSIIDAHIRALDVKLLVNVNKDINYPLSSPHNRGLHVKVQSNNELITELNIEALSSEADLLDTVKRFFDTQAHYVMITSAAAGESFPYSTPVYNRSAIDDKSYDSWDEDLEDLEDNADKLVTVFLNDQLRWQIRAPTNGQG